MKKFLLASLFAVVASMAMAQSTLYVVMKNGKEVSFDALDIDSMRIERVVVPAEKSGFEFQFDDATLTATVLYPVSQKKDLVIPTYVSSNDKEYTVTAIADEAFREKEESVTTPSEFTAFHITSIVIPNSVTKIGKNAFRECRGLKEIKLPNSLAVLDTFVFMSCVNLSKVELPSSLKEIKNGAFKYCTSLASLEIPSSVSVIEGQAFDACYALDNVVIPEGVAEIPGYCFNYCKSLTSVVVPSTVKKIGIFAFNYTKLSAISIPKDCEIEGSDAIPAGTKVVKY